MRRIVGFCALPAVLSGGILLLMPSGGLLAYADGPPWYVWRDDGCASCHWGQDIVEDSPEISVEGWPRRVEPGVAYPLRISFAAGDPEHLGFLATVRAGDAPAGRMEAGAGGIQTKESGARSGRPDFSAAGTTPGAWSLTWTAPETASGESPRLVIWVNEADGGGSQVGDRIHRKELAPGCD